MQISKQDCILDCGQAETKDRPLSMLKKEIGLLQVLEQVLPSEQVNLAKH